MAMTDCGETSYIQWKASLRKIVEQVAEIDPYKASQLSHRLLSFQLSKDEILMINELYHVKIPLSKPIFNYLKGGVIPEGGIMLGSFVGLIEFTDEYINKYKDNQVELEKLCKNTIQLDAKILLGQSWVKQNKNKTNKKTSSSSLFFIFFVYYFIILGLLVYAAFLFYFLFYFSNLLNAYFYFIFLFFYM